MKNISKDNLKNELDSLSQFISSLGDNVSVGSKHYQTIKQWKSAALQSIGNAASFKEVVGEAAPEAEDDSPEVAALEALNGYNVFNIEATANQRTYRAEVHLDQDFNDTAQNSIRQGLEIMIARMVEGQVENFINRAEPGRRGLRYRRSRQRPFPPPALPYLTPSPTTIEEQVAEEAGIVEAAVFKAFSSTDPALRVKVTIICNDSLGENVMGSATVQYYNSNNALKISLNPDEFGELGEDEINKWAGIMAHEFLHNLGWSHPKGEYTLEMPIEIYQACISGGHHLISGLIR